MKNTDVEKRASFYTDMRKAFNTSSKFYTAFFILIALWVIFTWRGLVTVIDVWYGNDIFNHGFFIVPGALYLIYLKRLELFRQEIVTTPFAFTLIIPAMLLYIVGLAGDVRLFMHTGMFVLLPSLIWLLIGTRAAKIVFFPLAFMLFSIPIGEQLIPLLQEIAADGSVALLRLSGIPLFRSGLYIEIPQGRFLVAEACSGVSFFIASFVIGSLYAYLNLSSTKQKTLFVVVSLAFPILANVIRVYGIILIAYWSDMEHAAGADHLIYGWFFFAFVIICLLGVGELMRDSGALGDNVNSKEVTSINTIELRSGPFFLSIILLLFGSYWMTVIHSVERVPSEPSEVYPKFINDEQCNNVGWNPVVKEPDSHRQIHLIDTECQVQLYTAWFSEKNNELISDSHREFSAKSYSLNDSQELIVKGRAFNVSRIVSVSGAKISVTTWFEIDDKTFTSEVKAKLYQLKNVLVSKDTSGRMYVLAVENHDLDSFEEALVGLL